MVPCPPPKNIAVSASGSQVELSWNVVQDATAYVISYGTNTTTYDFTEETLEPRFSIPGLDIDETWYFAVQAKYGDRKSALPSNPIVLKGGAVVSGTDKEDKQDSNQDEGVPGPFDSAQFAAEKAAWEALDIKSYRFTSKIDSDVPSIYVQSTVYPDKEPEITAGPGEPKEELRYSQYVKTIDEIYSYIEDLSTGNYFKFVVRYNKQYHYPEYFLWTKGPWSLGGWFGVEVTGFELLDEE
jgi:hypothetical protein